MMCKVLSFALAFYLLGLPAWGLPLVFEQLDGGTGSLEIELAKHFIAGQEATRKGHPKRAIREYREVLRLRPDLTAARVNLGLDYFLVGKFRQASLELERARQRAPHLVSANLFLGMSYLKMGLPAKAVSPLKDVLRQDSTNQEALRMLAKSYLDSGDYLDATNLYRRLFHLGRDPVSDWYELAKRYMAMAKQLADESEGKFQDSPWHAKLTGDILAEDHKWVDADASYQHALKLNERLPGLHAALGDMLLRQNRLEGAKAEYFSELRNDADSQEALLGLAAVDLANGAAVSALEQVSKAWEVFPPFLKWKTDFPPITIPSPKLVALARDIASAPNTPAREFLLANVYRAADRSQPAARQWFLFLSSLRAWNATRRNAVVARPPVGVACAAHRYEECAHLLLSQESRTPTQDIVLGQAQMALGNDEDAALAFAESVSRDEQNAEARYWLLISYQHLALKCIRQMVQLAPNSWRVHEIQGDYYQSHFEYNTAIKEFKAALRARPDSAELHERLGNVYLLDGDQAEAKQEIERALQIDPERMFSFYLMGRIYLLDHDIPKCIEYLQKVLQLDPECLPAHAALGIAYMREDKPASAAPELEQATTIDYDGNLHYLLSRAYRQLGKPDLAAQALVVSQRLRKKRLAVHQTALAAAEEALTDE